ncbi:MAG: ATP-binding cassette domain-containing protein [Anaerolineales bacterium]
MPVITFEDVAVRYRIPREGVSGLKEFAIRLVQRQIQYQEFWALKGVSFAVQGGEVFGIIGRNGAGKSTMLKVMARVLQPTRGRVVMRGRMAPLLELGGGFHPELTGRENVFLNMALLGFTRQETVELFDRIIAFSEIQDFIDAPLRTYSTGMVARLGFSVATCSRPDLLLVDEVLSVGDTQFQQKCLDRMAHFQQEGTTIVIVSHGLGTIQTLCDRVMWLRNGQIAAIGEPGEVIERYINQDQTQLWATPQNSPEDHTILDPRRQVYPTSRIFTPQSGSLSAWVQFNTYQNGSAAILFHTDDSRYVLYVQAKTDPDTGQQTMLITARAGGNQRAPDVDDGSFPEITAVYPLPVERLGQWAQVTMTWNGFPDGVLRLFLNGTPAGETTYNPAYNNDLPPARNLSVGMRPLNWAGERVRQPDGSIRELRPGSMMAVTDAQMVLQDVRLYLHALDAGAVAALYQAGMQLISQPDAPQTA